MHKTLYLSSSIETLQHFLSGKNPKQLNLSNILLKIIEPRFLVDLNYCKFLSMKYEQNHGKNLKELKLQVHKLAGNAGLYGYNEVSPICKEFDHF